MSFSTTGDSDTNSRLAEAQRDLIQSLDVVDDDNESIPFQRSSSKNERSNKNADSSGFDDRAQAKLAALSNAKKEAEDAKAAYVSSTNTDDYYTDYDTTVELHEKWNLSEQHLAHGYSQAIKYTSRITKNEEATKTAERLLLEWMDRFMDSFGVSLNIRTVTTTAMNKKKMIRTIHKVIIPALSPTTSESSSEANHPAAASENGDSESSPLPKIRIPPPVSKDYINLLRAYSVSKARRKGQHCEALMTNMVQLAKTVAYYYNDININHEWTKEKAYDVGMESVGSSEEGNETQKWRLWVNESIPNSKVFALAIKCHAGSTREYCQFNPYIKFDLSAELSS
jgi:hypothetical protein